MASKIVMVGTSRGACRFLDEKKQRKSEGRRGQLEPGAYFQDMQLQTRALPAVASLPISLLPMKAPVLRLAPTTETFAARSVIFESGEKKPRSFAVVRGLVEVRMMRSDGATPLLRLCPPGRWVLPVSVPNVFAVARLPSEVRTPETDENDAHEQCSLFAFDVAQMTEVHTESAGLAKLAKLLLLYASAFGQTRGRFTTVLPLTTIDLATALAIELRTVSRCLTTLRERGLVKREGQGLLSLQSLDGLAALCHL